MAEKIGLEAVFEDADWQKGTNEYLSRIDKMNSKTSSIAGSIGSEFQSMGGIIAASMAAATAAIAGLAALGAKELADWTIEGVQGALELEQQVAGIAAVMGETTDAVAPLEDLISDLALDPSLKVSATEAADAIELLARNGLTMDEIMGGAAENVVLLANATKADFGTAADLVTDAMAIFNIEADNMSGAVDGITSVVNNSKFSIEDYALALAQGGVSAAAMGVEFEDFNSIIAFTAANFTSGRTAGTGWSNFLVRLSPTTDSATEAMKELGIITEEGTNQFFDQEGSLKDLSSIIDIVNGAFGDLTEEQKIAYAQTIFGRDAAEALYSIIGKTGDEFVEFKGVLGETSAIENAQTATSTLAARLEVFRDLMEEIQRQSGKQFFELIGQITEQLIELASANSDQIVATFAAFAELGQKIWDQWSPVVLETLPLLVENIIALANYLIELAAGGEGASQWLTEMTPGFASLVEGITATVIGFNDFRTAVGEVVAKVQEFISPVTDFIAKHVELSDVLLAAGIAVAAFLAPLALAIAKMAAVGAAATAAVALIRTAWEEDLGGIQEFVTTVWEAIPEIIGTAIETIQTSWEEGFGGLRDFAEEVWTSIQEIIQTAIELIQTIIDTHGESLGTGLGTAYEALKIIVTSVWEQIQTIITTALDVIQVLLEGAIAFVQGDFVGAWEAAKLAVQTAIEGLVTIAEERFNALLELFNLTVGPGILAWFAEKFPETFQAFQDLIQTVVEQVLAVWEELAENLTLLWERIQEAATFLGEHIQTVFGAIGDFISDHADLLTDLLDTLWSNLIDIVESALVIISEALQLALNLITGDWEEAWDNVLAILEEIWEAIKSVVEIAVEAVKTAVQLGMDLVKAIIGEKATAAVEAFTGAFDGLPSKVTEIFQNIVTSVTSAASSLRDALFTAGQNAVQGFIDGINGLIGSAQAKLSELMGLSSQAAEAELEVESPSKRFKRMGIQTGEGYLLGLEESFRRVQQYFGDGFGSMLDGVNPAVNVAVAGAGSNVSTYAPSSSNSNYTHNSYVYNQMDAAQLEYTIRRIVNQMI